MKETHVRDREVIHERITTLTKKVDYNAKFVVGAGAVLATAVTLLQLFPPIFKVLTPPNTSATMVTPLDRAGWVSPTTSLLT